MGSTLLKIEGAGIEFAVNLVWVVGGVGDDIPCRTSCCTMCAPIHVQSPAFWSEKGVRLAQNMQVVSCIPLGMQRLTECLVEPGLHVAVAPAVLAAGGGRQLRT